ncbi:MAG: hypothetical protein AAFP79_12305 [Pseudomonadota bacterium]
MIGGKKIRIGDGDGYPFDANFLQEDRKARELLVQQVRAEARIGERKGFSRQRKLLFAQLIPYFEHFDVSFQENSVTISAKLNDIFVLIKKGKHVLASQALLAWLCSTNAKRAAEFYRVSGLSDEFEIDYRGSPFGHEEEGLSDHSDTSPPHVPSRKLVLAVIGGVFGVGLALTMWQVTSLSPVGIGETPTSQSLAADKLSGLWGEPGCSVTYRFDVLDRALKVTRVAREAGMGDLEIEFSIFPGVESPSLEGERTTAFETVQVNGQHEGKNVTFRHITNGSTERIVWAHRKPPPPAITLENCEGA